jgi:hypothetical protein
MVQITLNIPDQLAQEARFVAARTQRRVEDVLQEWLSHYMSERPVETMTDEAVLKLSNMQMPDYQQQELSDLLELNRENKLTVGDRKRLDELMTIYSQGMIRKAEALKVAVERNLMAPIG